MAGFGVTCFGIYKEIKKYKRGLDLHPGKTDGQVEKDAK